MLDGRSHAYVEAMNGLLQQAKTVAPGILAPENFIAIAYVRMSKLKHLPIKPRYRRALVTTGTTVMSVEKSNSAGMAQGHVS